VRQRVDLGVASEQRRTFVRAPTPGPGERCQRAIRLDGRVFAPESLRTERFVLDHVTSCGVGGGTNDDVPGICELLEPLRGVDHVAHHGGLAAGTHRTHDRFARIDTDSHFDRDSELGRDRSQGVEHSEGCPYGALRVVFVRDRRAELGDDLVADDLVEASSESRDVRHEPLEAVVDQPFDLLGVALGRKGREAHEVTHQDGHQTPLIRRDDQPLPALRAEPCAFRHRHATGRAGHARTLPARKSETAAERCGRSGARDGAARESC
jgi:hypothetical protein